MNSSREYFKGAGIVQTPSGNDFNLSQSLEYSTGSSTSRNEYSTNSQQGIPKVKGSIQEVEAESLKLKGESKKTERSPVSWSVDEVFNWAEGFDWPSPLRAHFLKSIADQKIDGKMNTEHS